MSAGNPCPRGIGQHVRQVEDMDRVDLHLTDLHLTDEGRPFHAY